MSAPVALCLADLHSNVTALRRLDALLARRRFDVVLAAGDITIPGHEAYAQDFVDVVRRHDCPLLLVHGNNDTLAAVEVFRREGVTIHRRERSLLGRRFVGFGGDGNADFDTELAEGETLELDPAQAVLLTHIPPRGLRYGPDLGPAPAEARQQMTGQPGRQALANAPAAHLCGHIHQLEGVAYVGPTKVVKLRAAMWNRCASLDLRTLRADFFDLGQ